MKIELSAEIAVYTGRARGKADRLRFKVDDLDESSDRVQVVVPSSVYSMTSSYFLALFGDSIRKLGGEAFLRKYELVAPEHVSSKVDDWIARALREKRGLFGGDV